MLNYVDRQALAKVHQYFDEVGYGYFGMHVLFIDGYPRLPEFGALFERCRFLYPLYRFLFTLFLQGHAADDRVVRAGFKSDVLEALTTTGLLVRDPSGPEWHTPDVLLIPWHGLYLAVNIPARYPTAARNGHKVEWNVHSARLIQALPPSLAQKRVLDLGSGEGLRALTCAARGAARVVCTTESATSEALVRFNVALNGADDCIEVMPRDDEPESAGGEQFDLVLGCRPRVPVSLEDEKRTEELLARAARMCTAGGQALIFCRCLGDQHAITLNSQALREIADWQRVEAQCYVCDKISTTDQASHLDTAVYSCWPSGMTGASAGLQEALVTLRQSGVAVEYCYDQVIRLRKGAGYHEVRALPIYNPEITDPLIRRVQVHVQR